MPIEDRYVKVPPDIAQELEALMPEIVQAAQEENPEISKDDLAIETGNAKGMLAEAAFGALMFVGGLAAETLTKKWLEEVLWPRIKPFVKDKSDAVFNYLRDLVEQLEKDREDEQG